jgi:hypothetical protein
VEAEWIGIKKDFKREEERYRRQQKKKSTMSSSAKLVGKKAGRKVESLASEAGVKMQSEEEGDDSQNGECEICSCWSDASSPALTASWRAR